MEEPHWPRGRRPPLPRCEHCGDVIGVYEPLVVGGDAGRRTTSLAAEPALGDAEVCCMHLACAEAGADLDMGAAL